VRAKAACSSGKSALRPDGPAGRIGHVMSDGSPSVRSTKSKNRESVSIRIRGFSRKPRCPRFRGGVAHRSADQLLSDSAAEGQKAASEQASAEQPGVQGTRFARPRRWNDESCEQPPSDRFHRGAVMRTAVLSQGSRAVWPLSVVHPAISERRHLPDPFFPVRRKRSVRLPFQTKAADLVSSKATIEDKP
jgi:hypothetical protein